MTTKPEPKVVREVIGSFFELDTLQDAVEELLSSGFKHESISMIAGQYTVRQKLGDYYSELNEDSNDPDAPRTAFVAKKAVGDTVHAIFGSLYFLGVTVAAGAVVATAGIIASAITVAAAGSATIAGIAGVLATIIHEGDAEEIEEQIDEGHLVLFVRTSNNEQEKLATDILSKHASTDVKVCTVKSDD